MDINTFIEQTGGNWFSQRTTYNLADSQVENSKADLTMEILTLDHPKINQLCNDYQINSEANLKAISTSWDTAPDWGNPKQIGSRMLLLIPDDNNSDTGKIFRLKEKPEKALISGHYSLGKDDSLTLILEENNSQIEERIWFASENLRLRTTVVKEDGYCVQTSFYSEIRKVVNK
jgi:hypothetical protein